MQVPNHIVDPIISMLLNVRGGNERLIMSCRDELIRCQERDKLQVRIKESNEIELHENLFQLSSMYGDWLTKNDLNEYFTGGSGNAMESIIDWSKEFTESNKDRVWDGEWYDELEVFFNDKINSLK